MISMCYYFHVRSTIITPSRFFLTIEVEDYQDKPGRMSRLSPVYYNVYIGCASVSYSLTLAVLSD